MSSHEVEKRVILAVPAQAGEGPAPLPSYRQPDTPAFIPSRNDVALLPIICVCEIVRSWLAFGITSVIMAM